MIKIKPTIFIFLLLSGFYFDIGHAENPIIPGKVIFTEIPQLPFDWWKDPESAWTIWDKNTYYLWGANQGNYQKKFMKKLKGSGMASSKGPSRGRAHPHYIGIITTKIYPELNDLVFSELEEKLKMGSNIVIPALDGRFALGTNSAFRRYSPIQKWYISQEYLFEKIIHLSSIASEVVFDEGTYWPDCGKTKKKISTVNIPIGSTEDIQGLLPYLKSRQRKALLSDLYTDSRSE